MLRISAKASAAPWSTDSALIQRSTEARNDEAKRCPTRGCGASSSPPPPVRNASCASSSYSCSRLSSSMMTAHTETHSSQMYALGSSLGFEISFRTALCALRQKEHWRGGSCLCRTRASSCLQDTKRAPHIVFRQENAIPTGPSSDWPHSPVMGTSLPEPLWRDNQS